MYRGTTPTLTFNIPFKKDEINNAIVTIQDVNVKNNRITINKSREDNTLLVQDNLIITTLTQKETLQFDEKDKIEIQLRILTNEKVALASKIFHTTMEKILKEGEISEL